MILDIIEDYITIKASYEQRSDIIAMHASGMLYKGVPIVFIGATHSGKSTAILKLLHVLYGANFISDDLLLFERKGENVYLQPFSMTLHVRLNSLVYNQFFPLEQVEPDVYYANINSEHINGLIKVTTIFNIKHDPEEIEVCEEVTGIKKNKMLLENLKYYFPNAATSVISIFSKVRLYELKYSSDAFLISSLKDTINLPCNGKLHNNLSKIFINLIMQGAISAFKVQGSSMLPTFKHNQIVSIKLLNISDVKVGDVIIFKKFTHFTMHRVIDIIKDDSYYAFKTKGDGNIYEDDYIVNGEEYLCAVNDNDGENVFYL